AARTERLEEACLEAAHVAELQLVAPFGAPRVEPRARVLGDDREAALGVEIRNRAPTEAQVVRSPRLLVHVDDDDAPAFLEMRAHIDPLEIPHAVQQPRGAHQLLVAQVLAGLDADAIADLAPQRLGVGSSRALDPYRDDGPLVDGG